MKMSKSKKIIGGVALVILLIITSFYMYGGFGCRHLSNCWGAPSCFLSGTVNDCVITCLFGQEIHCTPIESIGTGTGYIPATVE